MIGTSSGMLDGLCQLRTGGSDEEVEEACKARYLGGSGTPSEHKREFISTIQDGDMC